MKRQWKLYFPAPVIVYNTEVTVSHIQSKNKRLEVAYILARFTLQMLKSRSCLDWKRSSRWVESWEGLLFATDVSTTCAEANFRVKMAYQQVVETSVANNSPSKGSNHPDDVFNQCMLLLGSKHFLNQNHLRVTITPISGVSNSVSNMGAALRIPRVFPPGILQRKCRSNPISSPSLKIGDQS